MKGISMAGQWLLIFFCALLVGCGKYGAPQRVQREAAPEVEFENVETVPVELIPESDDEEDPF
jgi:hypothetical protein